MTATYEQVVKAAQRLVTDDTKDTWGLADAVLAHVPEQQSGKRNDLTPASGGGSVSNELADLAKQMKDDGISTQNGDPYTGSSLGHMRDTAMAWQTVRHPEAAYRTHQEAGSPTTDGGKVLAALCAVARGEKPVKPRGIDADAWNKAVARVQARRKGFPVAANDVRVALERKVNVPTAAPAVTPAAVKAAVAAGDLDLGEVVDDADPEEQEAIEQRVRKNRVKRQIAAGEEGMTDAELEESDKEMEALGNMANAVATAAKSLGTFHPYEEYTGRSKRELQTVLTIVRKRNHVANDYEIECTLSNTADIRLLCDLVDMAAQGGDVGAQAEKFLESLEQNT